MQEISNVIIDTLFTVAPSSTSDVIAKWATIITSIASLAIAFSALIISLNDRKKQRELEEKELVEKEQERVFTEKSLKPYLSFEEKIFIGCTANNDPHLQIMNTGLGTAIIKKVSYLWDDKELDLNNGLATPLTVEVKTPWPVFSTIRILKVGQMIPENTKYPIVTIQTDKDGNLQKEYGENFTEFTQTIYQKLKINVEFESLFAKEIYSMNYPDNVVSVYDDRIILKEEE